MFDPGALIGFFKTIPKDPVLFISGRFLFIFSVFLVIYSFFSEKIFSRNILLILFSFYFYFLNSGLFLVLLVSTISLDYIFARSISRSGSTTLRKIYLVTGIIASLSFLFYFKYRNFFIANFNAAFGKHYPVFELILPIGISFYTFQSISFLVDSYRKKIELPEFTEYLMYMSFFPHLVAGPIVRAADFLQQVRRKISITKENMQEAFYLISKGFIKKAIIGDFIAQYADIVFSQPAGFSGIENIFATLCYTFQIFFDFSGYTDMAIGIALLLGFRLNINFLSPYKSTNITDFWRRWHISLSSWLRDYIYIPLGGNAKGFYTGLLFVLMTMLIGGFWHGADWKFVFWGGAHGMLLVLHRIFRRFVKMDKAIMRPVFWLLTFSCVALLWIPFRAMNLSDTFTMYRSMFTDIQIQKAGLVIKNNPLLAVMFLIGFLLALTPTAWKEKFRILYFRTHYAMKLALLVILFQVFLQVRSEEVHPFIYFSF